MRSKLIRPSLALFALATLLGAGAQTDRVAWLEQHAVPIATIDPAVEDFSDLEPLVDAIGDATIVQLGESSHGAGATFSGKVRLIKFLHQRMGFDVVVWESGMYDLSKTNAALRDGDDPIAAGRLGVFGIWSGVEEVAPLWEYAAASWSGDRPLEMAGYDMQFSGSAGSGYFDELAEFVAAVDDEELAQRTTALVATADAGYEGFGAFNTARWEEVARLRDAGVTGEEQSAALAEWGEANRARLSPTSADLDVYRTALDELLELLDNPAFADAHSAVDLDFMRHTVINARGFGTSIYERSAIDAPTEGPEQLVWQNRGWNRRDTRNADIMRWFVEERYAGRKVIIWAHNGHIMNAYYKHDWTELIQEPQLDGMKPVGVFLDEMYGDDVYTIGFTAYEGSAPFGGGGEVVGPAPEGSLEHALHTLGHPHAFLDFRQLDDQPNHWRRQPSTMAIRGYMPEELPDWTRVVDAMFFNDVMTPSQRIQ
ncbi:MAG: hypothetical protein GKS06_00125 [Acidobacteria bacterium]|nr:hypothetical protein [Acidobacteriota bacterium]